MLDLLIRGGTVFDGTGKSPARVDVAVKDGRVVELSPRIDAVASRVVDATGKWVTPGFVDIHTHYDLEVEIAPGLGESVRHGVTSVVMGNCSLSLTVGEPDDLAHIFQRVENLPRALVKEWLAQAVAWKSPREYIEHLAALPLGPNVVPLLGHSALRAAVMGLERSLTVKEPTNDELSRMEALADEALEAGCAGISIDMVPWHMMDGVFMGRTIPSQHAGMREIAALAEVCRRRDRVFQMTPNPHRPSSLMQLLRLCRPTTGIPLRATVLAALDVVNRRWLWRTYRPLLFFVNRVLGGNVRFQTLTEPFTVISDGPLGPLFEEFPAGIALNDLPTREERLAKWQEPGFKERFRREWVGNRLKTFHRDLEIITIVSCPDASLVGKTVAEVARARGERPLDCFVSLLCEHDDALRWHSVGANDRAGPRQALIEQPYVFPGFTDAGAHVRNLSFHDGALALLREAKQTGFMTPEAAIRRVTGEPATWFRLDAGILAPGKRADLVVLEPSALDGASPPPTEHEDPLLSGALHLVKRGNEDAIEAVYIAGVEVARHGEPTSALGEVPTGRVLLPSPTIADDETKHRERRMWLDRAGTPHPFVDYWDVFVLKHQDPVNVGFHVVGMLWLVVIPATALATMRPDVLLLLPGSQLIGLIGHLLFERAYIDLKDAVFSPRATRSLLKMMWLLVRGRYGDEIRRLKAELERYRQERAARGDATEVARPAPVPSARLSA